MINIWLEEMRKKIKEEFKCYIELSQKSSSNAWIRLGELKELAIVPDDINGLEVVFSLEIEDIRVLEILLGTGSLYEIPLVPTFGWQNLPEVNVRIIIKNEPIIIFTNMVSANSLNLKNYKNMDTIELSFHRKLTIDTQVATE